MRPPGEGRVWRVWMRSSSPPAPGAGVTPRIPWVYVGSSAREPEIRFEQHRRGYKVGGAG